MLSVEVDGALASQQNQQCEMMQNGNAFFSSQFFQIDYTHAFQPIIDIEEGKTVSYEVLVRGINNEPPFTIYEQISDTPDLMSFEQHNRESALVLANKLGLETGLNFNFTPGSVLQKDGFYVEKTIDAASEYGLKANQLTIEIVENEVVKNYQQLLKNINSLRRKGVIIAIDDFGAGYAGLNLLVHLQPDVIKLDMQLIRNIDSHGPRQSIVRAICDVCLDLGIDILAEGVETREEFEFLNSMGITMYQGFLFARPGFKSLPDIDLSLYCN